jgi:hypothetical protein
VWDALYDVEPWARGAMECCPANSEFDFLESNVDVDAIATNPPYGRQAEAIVRHALERTKSRGGKVAMLLPHAWDTAKGRIDLFGLPFRCKWILTHRIRWENIEQKSAGPSMNHGWLVWDWAHCGAPVMGWI